MPVNQVESQERDERTKWSHTNSQVKQLENIISSLHKVYEQTRQLGGSLRSKPRIQPLQVARHEMAMVQKRSCDMTKSLGCLQFQSRTNNPWSSHSYFHLNFKL